MRCRTTCLTAMLAMALAAPSVAQDDKPRRIDLQARSIIAHGSASESVKPDTVQIHIMVETREPVLAQARTGNADAVKKVQGAVEALKLQNATMETTSVSVEIVYPHHDSNEIELPRPLGYRVIHTLSVNLRQRNIAELNVDTGRIVDTALASGANRIDNVSFRKSVTEAETRRVMARAVEAALANARAYAQGAGVAIKEVLAIEGEPPEEWPAGTYRPAFSGAGFGGGMAGMGGGMGGPRETPTTIRAGEIEIIGNVKVVCSY